MNIDSSKYTAHKHPGKFECTAPWVEYFYERMMEGDGELLCAYPECDTEQEAEQAEAHTTADLFQVNAEESEAFGLDIGSWVWIAEDSQGFAIGHNGCCRKDAEKSFTDWAG
jgi:hypothetical protein